MPARPRIWRIILGALLVAIDISAGSKLYGGARPWDMAIPRMACHLLAYKGLTLAIKGILHSKNE